MRCSRSHYTAVRLLHKCMVAYSSVLHRGGGRDASLVFGSPSPSWPGLCIALYRVSGCFFMERGSIAQTSLYSLCVLFEKKEQHLNRIWRILLLFGGDSKENPKRL